MNGEIMEIGARIELTLTILQTVYSPRMTLPCRRAEVLSSPALHPFKEVHGF